MNQLHVIEKTNSIERCYEGRELYLAAGWRMSLKTAERLVGSEFHAHEKQVSPSHFSGVILDYRRWKEDGKFEFLVRRDERLQCAVTPREGWGFTRKFVWNESEQA